MSQRLASHRIGRVLLHALCAWQDHHWRWHWLGIVREFVRVDF